MRTLSSATAAVALLLCPLEFACSRRPPARVGPGGASVRPGEPLEVRRGRFEERVLLTGEIDAARGTAVSIPDVPFSPVTLRWLEADGVDVAAGQKVAEIDSGPLAAQVEEKQSALERSRLQIEAGKETVALGFASRRYDVERLRGELEKARLDAEVPESIRPKREYQEKQLRLARAEADLRKAGEELEAYRKVVDADRAAALAELGKTERELARARAALAAVSLVSPRAGTLVVADHPWEGRKIQSGDSLWPGQALVRLPEPGDLEVVAQLADVDDGRVRAGDRARIVLDADPAAPIEGKVEEVADVAQEPARQSARRAFRVRISLPAAGRERLRPGMSVRVEIPRGAIADALLVPRAAVDFDAKPPRVRSPRGKPLEVELGPCNASDCVVVRGPEAGTKLAPAGHGDGEAR